MGIDVYLHWSWLILVMYLLQVEHFRYASALWGVLEYVVLFAIVLTHEFGHALACRSVGGQAEQIVLWPLGGVAYVNPPRRPGAMLWSIVAGPLVNVMLVPVFLAAWYLAAAMGLSKSLPDAARFILTLNIINASLLVFNLLPIYPLDGGQIGRSLLWFVFGEAQSLVITTGVGFFGVIGLIAFAVWAESWWFGIMALFILLNCAAGLRRGLAMARIARAPRRAGFACPACQKPPPVGRFWVCGKCSHIFDAFEALSTCPKCGYQFNATRCLECGVLNPLSHWVVAAPTAGPAPPRI
jgi:Zn-dependent protease